MNRIAFVTSWYGEDIPGGAEKELRGLAEHFNKSDINMQVEVLTTCIKEFSSDWNVDFYKAGEYQVNGVLTRRFKVRKRNTEQFDKVNYKLIHKIPITLEEEQTFIQEMANSTDLYKYIEQKKDEYDLFIYIPYMFGTTYYGIKACPEKAVLLPCFHDESYIYMNIYKRVFEETAGVIYLAEPECELANRVFDFSKVQQKVLGAGVDAVPSSDGNRFKNKYKIDKPYILYAGRKDVGKNVDKLLLYFSEYKKRNNSDLQLVLIGGGSIEIPLDIIKEVHDLGYVDLQDKYDAYNGALVLCQPSTNESFSLVIMESWLCGRPIIVHENCKVTSYFAKQSNGGLYFKDYFEFEASIHYLQNNIAMTNRMGSNGKKFVEENFSWNIIVERYYIFFKSIIEKNNM